ncbi:MAG: ferrous iron transport protein A [Gammaproteobacteria bacterium]|nr:ferrous iron transport protein A [Gammaproteobacteria bacterium]
MTLAEARRGTRVCIAGIGDAVPAARREHLQAYGLAAGQRVRVVQQSPVTVVQIEHTELALDAELACAIDVWTGEELVDLENDGT